MIPHEAMKAAFMNELTNGKKADCPCCGRYAQVYKRRIHHTVARQLIKLYRAGGHEKFVHTSNILLPHTTGIGDFTKAKYWHLIQEMPNDGENKSKNSGYWMLTGRGRLFVEGKVAVSSYALVYDDEVLGYSDRPANITDCLGKKFNYHELMGGI